MARAGETLLTIKLLIILEVKIRVIEETFSMFDEYLRSKDLNIVRGLTIAIELEIKSRNYYQAKSIEIKSPAEKMLLQFLANEELMHLKVLENVKRNLEKNNRWIDIKEISPGEMGKPHLYEGKWTEPRIEIDPTDEDILLAALSAERKSEEYYHRMSDKVKDKKGKNFFETLARFEKTHYETIKEFLKP